MRLGLEPKLKMLKAFLKQRPSWSINFIYKEGNRATQVLAKLGLVQSYERIWMEDFSPKISQIVLDELT